MAPSRWATAFVYYLFVTKLIPTFFYFVSDDVELGQGLEDAYFFGWAWHVFSAVLFFPALLFRGMITRFLCSAALGFVTAFLLILGIGCLHGVSSPAARGLLDSLVLTTFLVLPISVVSAGILSFGFALIELTALHYYSRVAGPTKQILRLLGIAAFLPFLFGIISASTFHYRRLTVYFGLGIDSEVKATAHSAYREWGVQYKKWTLVNTDSSSITENPRLLFMFLPRCLWYLAPGEITEVMEFETIHNEYGRAEIRWKNQWGIIWDLIDAKSRITGPNCMPREGRGRGEGVIT